MKKVTIATLLVFLLVIGTAFAQPGKCCKHKYIDNGNLKAKSYFEVYQGQTGYAYGEFGRNWTYGETFQSQGFKAKSGVSAEYENTGTFGNCNRGISGTGTISVSGAYFKSRLTDHQNYDQTYRSNLRGSTLRFNAHQWGSSVSALKVEGISGSAGITGGINFK